MEVYQPSGLSDRHNAAPIRMGSRPPPAPDVLCFALSGLLWPEGRARFHELGVGPEAFDDGDAVMIASRLLTESEFTPQEVRILWCDDGRTLPWGMAIDRTGSPELAVLWVENFAADHAVSWLPIWLGWIGEGLREGQPLDWAVQELDWLLITIRPLVARTAA